MSSPLIHIPIVAMDCVSSSNVEQQCTASRRKGGGKAFRGGDTTAPGVTQAPEDLKKKKKRSKQIGSLRRSLRATGRALLDELKKGGAGDCSSRQEADTSKPQMMDERPKSERGGPVENEITENERSWRRVDTLPRHQQQPHSAGPPPRRGRGSRTLSSWADSRRDDGLPLVEGTTEEHICHEGGGGAFASKSLAPPSMPPAPPLGLDRVGQAVRPKSPHSSPNSMFGWKAGRAYEPLVPPNAQPAKVFFLSSPAASEAWPAPYAPPLTPAEEEGMLRSYEGFYLV